MAVHSVSLWDDMVHVNYFFTKKKVKWKLQYTLIENSTTMLGKPQSNTLPMQQKSPLENSHEYDMITSFIEPCTDSKWMWIKLSLF
jgi:hypothetical protein